MIRKTYYAEEEIQLKDGQTARLYYYLLSEDSHGCESYGAEVAMERGGFWETATARHITTSSARMRAMIELLRRNTVTPCTLHEIILEEINKY